MGYPHDLGNLPFENWAISEELMKKPSVPGPLEFVGPPDY